MAMQANPHFEERCEVCQRGIKARHRRGTGRCALHPRLAGHTKRAVHERQPGQAYCAIPRCPAKLATWNTSGVCTSHQRLRGACLDCSKRIDARWERCRACMRTRKQTPQPCACGKPSDTTYAECRGCYRRRMKRYARR